MQAAAVIPSRPYWPGKAARFQTDDQWAAELVAPFPMSWAGRLMGAWRERHRIDRRGGNIEHLKRVRQIEQAHRAGVPADAGDAELCQVAHDTARDMARRLEQRHGITRASLGSAVSPWSVDWAERVPMLAAWAEALHWLAGRGLEAVGLAMRGRLAGCLRRVTCERWWRRILRRLHAQAVEGTARVLGLVHKRAGCYVSDDTLHRRTGQIERNARALESVEAVNEHGQRFTLAELAARGPANREIRRHELMTRIAGFEAVARDCGHVAYFVTVTCPSRMHAWRTKPGSTWATEPNPAHDGTTPDQAQQHLAKQWGRFRAAADRAGLQLYGFRIAEPNHDGTPHWHALLFFPAMGEAGGGRGQDRVFNGSQGGGAHGGKDRRRPAYRLLVRFLRKYFLWQADPQERGARRHRVKLERIDWQRGSAAGYVAKYVAKNIDGYKVEKDLYGNDCLTASRRVDAWASTWRIRQFQQIGGAPVGIWRELRRLHPEQAEAAVGVSAALDAVNLASAMKGAEVEAIRRHTAAHGWAAYLALQGGTRVRRQALRIKLLRDQSGEVGRYGDLIAPAAVGVWVEDRVCEYRPALGIVREQRVWRTVVAEVESERASWIVVPRGSGAGIPKPPGVRESVAGQHQGPMRVGAGIGQPADAGPVAGNSRDARSAAPWSPVNNCTRGLSALDEAHRLRMAGELERAPGDLFGAPVTRYRKRGRWHQWAKARESEREHGPDQRQ
jgi:Bacteriophage replication gene A protein (GPA)